MWDVISLISPQRLRISSEDIVSCLSLQIPDWMQVRSPWALMPGGKRWGADHMSSRARSLSFSMDIWDCGQSVGDSSWTTGGISDQRRLAEGRSKSKGRRNFRYSSVSWEAQLQGWTNWSSVMCVAVFRTEGWNLPDAGNAATTHGSPWGISLCPRKPPHLSWHLFPRTFAIQWFTSENSLNPLFLGWTVDALPHHQKMAQPRLFSALSCISNKVFICPLPILNTSLSYGFLHCSLSLWDACLHPRVCLQRTETGWGMSRVCVCF